MYDLAVVSAKGARRWQLGHPWIYRSDVVQRPSSSLEAPEDWEADTAADGGGDDEARQNRKTARIDRRGSLCEG